MMNYDLQNELVAWLPLDRGVHNPLRPIDVPEQQLPPQLFTDDLIYSFRVKLFQNKENTSSMDCYIDRWSSLRNNLYG